ncbi:conserved hypothetical protein [Mesorhizobium plurifarium]|uniref:DUF1636 domain-containing protein n=1 Tax=Mesorhizobium plurifarium TaxID=69974 RepID=A0A090E5U0_MESPL|nr:conserved hypothetical protein [Mesorhizobium plurifarium]CDX62557.1 conserved hypothetical protein [Mesorhizobium plurifarium]
MAQRPASQETCHRHELTGRGVPGGDAGTGLSAGSSIILPSPFWKVTEMLDASSHRIIVCSLCRDSATGLRSGEDLCADLRSRLAQTSASSFAVETVDCMAGCSRPLTVAFNAHGKAGYLFGSIDSGTDVGALVEFARLYASLADGWCSSDQRPARLAGKILARIPAGGREQVR